MRYMIWSACSGSCSSLLLLLCLA
uniref:Uncharacterized protein n=1 Tax=Arundo donax TaxID=35708 RepID=A0A0A8Z3Z3_ARUDO